MATREKNPDKPAPDREERYPLSARVTYHRTHSLSSRNMSQFSDYWCSRDPIRGPRLQNPRLQNMSAREAATDWSNRGQFLPDEDPCEFSFGSDNLPKVTRPIAG
jgi:hypothetical protein